MIKRPFPSRQKSRPKAPSLVSNSVARSLAKVPLRDLRKPLTIPDHSKKSIKKSFAPKPKALSKHVEQQQLKDPLQSFGVDKALISKKQERPVVCYAVNSNRGLVREFNQDRIAIVENLQLTRGRCSYFGLFDGHGGEAVAHDLSQGLHRLIVSNPLFQTNIEQAIKDSFMQVQSKYIKNQKSKSIAENCGSCALIAFVLSQQVVIANLGDSRALLLTDSDHRQLTRDHRPNDPEQLRRIQSAGGSIYQSDISQIEGNYEFSGPFRVKPGGLSVSRTIGDLSSKLTQLGGRPGTVIAQPEIHSFQIEQQELVLLLGCDGIFQNLSNEQVAFSFKEGRKGRNAHERLGRGVDSVLGSCFEAQSSDNLSLIGVCVSLK